MPTVDDFSKIQSDAVDETDFRTLCRYRLMLEPYRVRVHRKDHPEHHLLSTITSAQAIVRNRMVELAGQRKPRDDFSEVEANLIWTGINAGRFAYGWGTIGACVGVVRGNKFTPRVQKVLAARSMPYPQALPNPPPLLITPQVLEHNLAQRPEPHTALLNLLTSILKQLPPVPAWRSPPEDLTRPEWMPDYADYLKHKLGAVLGEMLKTIEEINPSPSLISKISSALRALSLILPVPPDPVTMTGLERIKRIPGDIREMTNGGNPLGQPRKYLKPSEMNDLIGGFRQFETLNRVLENMGWPGSYNTRLQRRLLNHGVPPSVFVRGSSHLLRDFVLANARALRTHADNPKTEPEYSFESRASNLKHAPTVEQVVKSWDEEQDEYLQGLIDNLKS